MTAVLFGPDSSPGNRSLKPVKESFGSTRSQVRILSPRLTFHRLTKGDAHKMRTISWALASSATEARALSACCERAKGLCRRRKGLGLCPRDRLDLSFFLPPLVSRIPQAPLTASQHLNGSAPNHFQHHDTPGNPCYERSRNCYRLLQALEAIREALMAGGCLGCSSHPNSCPGAGSGWIRPPATA